MRCEIGRDDVKTQCCGVSLVLSVCVAVVVLFSHHFKTVCRFTVSLHHSRFVDTQNSTCLFLVQRLEERVASFINVLHCLVK